MQRLFISFSFLCACIYSIYSLVKIITTQAPDFSIFYYATIDFWHKQNAYINTSLYSLFPYPPVTALFYMPFLAFSYPVSQSLFIIISYLSIFALIYITQLILIKRFILFDFLCIATLVLISFPFKFTLGMGQINILAFLLVIISFYLYLKKYRLVAAILFTVGIIFKPIFGFILLFYILKKEIYFLNIFFSTLIICLLISFIAFGFEATAYYIQYIIPHFSDVSGREVYYNQGLLGFISRLITDLSLRKIIFYSLVLASICLLGFLWIKQKIDDIQLLALVITTLSFLDPLAWQHHFIILLFPCMYLFYNLRKDKHTIAPFILFAAYILISINIKNPSLFSTFPHQFVLSHVLYGALLVYGVLLYSIFRRSGRT